MRLCVRWIERYKIQTNWTKRGLLQILLNTIYKVEEEEEGVFFFVNALSDTRTDFQFIHQLNSPPLPRTSCSWIYFCFLSFNLLLMVFSALQAVLLTMVVVVEFYIMILYSMYYLIRTTHNAKLRPKQFF